MKIYRKGSLPPGMKYEDLGYGLLMVDLIREAMLHGLDRETVLERALALKPDASEDEQLAWAKAAGVR